MRRFQVAVILINYNSSSYTLDCLRSIEQQTARSLRFQIIIVDNNSSLDEFRKLDVLRTKDNVKIVRSRINLGFSGGNMMGVQHADADYYYFLNNDCVLLNDCLSIFYRLMEVSQDVANCSGEMFIANGEYEYNFRYFPSLALKLVGSGLLRLFNPAGFPKRQIRMQAPTPVDLVNGSSMFIRALPFEHIGGFDTVYFLYCEEEDIALRLKRAGYATVLVPEAKYQHFVSRSTNAEGPVKLLFLKEFYISFLYYFNKNYSFGYRLLMQIFCFFKVGRKFYRNLDYARLAWFIAGGAPLKHSLRFSQKVSDR